MSSLAWACIVLGLFLIMHGVYTAKVDRLRAGRPDVPRVA